VNGVAVTSNGEVLATGSFLGTTTGAATLVAAGTTAPDLFLLQLSGASGATDFAAGYGDSLPQTGDGIAVNRFGTAWFAATGSLNGSVAFPAPAGTVTAAAGARDLLLLVGQVK
jgi:Ca2+/Na+ antiporter